MTPFEGAYRGRRVLITGHTGFKGSWLACWLKRLGAEVTGVSLDPAGRPNHWDLLRLDAADRRHDIRDAALMRDSVRAARPEIVFHLAAQSLVRRSYADPLANWSCNVMGTANVLDACRGADGLKAVVAVTTDKVYENREWAWGYREGDALGGRDPYAASKAACELLIDSYRKSFFGAPGSPLIASARAGNVIGGGDWSEDRLIPDLVRAMEERRPLVIRAPRATRPWQHVLDCLSGYLLLGQMLLEGKGQFAEAWNFGPAPEDNRAVAEVLELMRGHWPGLSWTVATESQPHEANLLYLDCAKARTRLGWRPAWGIAEALRFTSEWYRGHAESGAVATGSQLEFYMEAAAHAGLAWADG